MRRAYNLVFLCVAQATQRSLFQKFGEAKLGASPRHVATSKICLRRVKVNFNMSKSSK